MTIYKRIWMDPSLTTGGDVAKQSIMHLSKTFSNETGFILINGVTRMKLDGADPTEKD